VTTPFSEVIAGLNRRDDDCFHTDPGEDWRQGRTLFGGLSAALCHAACERLIGTPPPLRSAQIAYIGPSAGAIALRPAILRQGKSMTFAACDLAGEQGLATRALFCFGAPRPTALAFDAPGAPDVPPPEDCPALFRGGKPTFAHHLDQRLAGGAHPGSGAGRGEMLVWVRIIDPAPPATPSTLVALGDALPPATMPRLSAPAAISTVSWQLDFMAGLDFGGGDAPDPAGWFLLRSTEEASGEGYSAQRMSMWDAAGRPVLIARQSVAVFA
jgi:acyl-CoA thioesterase